jgi:predicted GNAT family N-acyltransferase
MTKRPARPGKSKSPIIVRKIQDKMDLESAMKIRYEVFVIGQNVPAEEEIDQYEGESFHFLALVNNTPVGAARWRFTGKGIKLERFAVLEKYRGKGVGSALVSAVLNDIDTHPRSDGKEQYLHAQLSAMRLYSKFGFTQEGSMFQECDIDHYKMTR